MSSPFDSSYFGFHCISLTLRISPVSFFFSAWRRFPFSHFTAYESTKINPLANLEQVSGCRCAFSLYPVLRNFTKKSNRSLFPFFFCLSVSVHVIFEATGPISIKYCFRMPHLNSSCNLTLNLVSLLLPLFSVHWKWKLLIYSSNMSWQELTIPCGILVGDM
jgi:hypothetical protein